MKISTVFKLMAISAFAVVAWSVGGSQTAVAQEAPTAEPIKAEAVYSYEAQPGDSYTKIARKAVQTYGAINQVSLSEAQIVFAETNLTQAAGSPELEVGQKVEISESQIAEWVKKAGELTEEQEAAWDVYTPYVNFNTDNVGQAN